ncbi:MAG: glycosyltransferase [Fibrobacteraceae bacterium]|nr:glycosyltransferase [Fibrobacteraceae bacterium]
MAIPKVIHYCWLSGEPYPDLVRKCMESWQKYLPDYQFVLWDGEKIKEIDCSWVDSAIAAKKWAFAADYIRLYALHNYGGIYLDCDVEVIKPFDDLLERSYFVGRETHKNVIEAAVMGAEPSLNWLKDALDWYESKEFNVTQLNNPAIAIPVILKNVLSKKSNVAILPAEFFSPKDNRTGNVKITQNTYTIHHFDGNWFNNYQREYFRRRVKYSKKYGALIGFIVASLFSLKKKMKILEI